MFVFDTPVYTILQGQTAVTASLSTHQIVYFPLQTKVSHRINTILFTLHAMAFTTRFIDWFVNPFCRPSLQTRHIHPVGLMLGQRRRRWPNIKLTLGQPLVAW